MNIYTIYRATNCVNGKVYIGFDSSWPSRKLNHKAASKTQSCKFYNAIRKYGWDSFVWEVIYQSLDYNHTLNTMEDYFIKEHDSIFCGYNSKNGGSLAGAYWINNGVIEMMINDSETIPPGYCKGRLTTFGGVHGAHSKGSKWWNNGVDSTMSRECPGPEYKPGRLAKYGPSKAETKYLINPKLCSICNTTLNWNKKNYSTCGNQLCVRERQRNGPQKRWAKSRYTLA